MTDTEIERVARRYGRNLPSPWGADDMAQEIRVRLLRSRPAPEHAFTAALRAAWRFSRWCRRACRRPPGGVCPLTCEPTVCEPEDLTADERRVLWRRLEGLLSADQMAAVNLCVVGELTTRAAGRLLGVSTGTVHARLRAAGRRVKCDRRLMLELGLSGGDP